ncbi:SH3 domain-containing protein [Psychroserpens sp.]|uniref:SH3 domain-containing protein n=1 Tax=Psychroserpens sp. TaxID=2020870 RepID=UPI002B2716FE|nr:SH3 domain-containing protein [Psychroserpens sp.]
MSAQDKTEIHYKDLVESYYDKRSKTPLFIYDSFNGKIIDTLYNVEDKKSWYKIAITDSEYGWFKIKNIQRLPNAYINYGYENRWVKTTNFLITVDDFDESHNIYLYDQPTIESNKIHKVDSNQTAKIIETSGLWVKIRFKVDKKFVEGWLSFKNQCAHPWTTCPETD